MLTGAPDCIVSPSPELEERILNTREQILAGKAPPAKGTKKLVDAVSYGLIVGRPSGTRAHTLVSPTKDFAPVTGTRQAVVLLIDFEDEPATQTQDHFEQMLFSVGSYPGGSMRDFYLEASYGQLDVTGEVYGSGGPTAGWFRAPRPKSYYTDGNYGFNGYPKNAQKLVEDVLATANPSVNFSAFDNGTGAVEALIVICAGEGGEETGDTGDFW
ncbi:MAG: immune inhibitor A domain-containing protein, partial [Acidimicrobiales bacterium]